MPYADRAKYLECCRKRCKQYYQRHHAEQLARAACYRQANREAVAERQCAWIRQKFEADPTYRLRTACQGSWKCRCRQAGVYHAEPFLELLGTTWEQFVRYIERRFQPGMSWENFGAWSLDHALPVSAFNLRKREERAMCFHFKNLSPMWFDENRRKNGSYVKADLERYKRFWRMTYGPKPKQLKFADEPERPF
jgi:hypothetical protein